MQQFTRWLWECMHKYGREINTEEHEGKHAALLNTTTDLELLRILTAVSNKCLVVNRIKRRTEQYRRGLLTHRFKYFGTRKAEVLNSLIINTTAKANDTTDILQTFR